MTFHHKAKDPRGGFTIIEMMLTFFIVTLVLAGSLATTFLHWNLWHLANAHQDSGIEVSAGLQYLAYGYRDKMIGEYHEGLRAAEGPAVTLDTSADGWKILNGGAVWASYEKTMNRIVGLNNFVLCTNVITSEISDYGSAVFVTVTVHDTSGGSGISSEERTIIRFRN